MRLEIEAIEHKLRRPGGLWSDEALLHFYSQHIPEEINTAAAFHRWLEKNEDQLLLGMADVVDEDLEYLELDGFPDSLSHGDHEYSLYYHAKQGERDDGVTLGVHVDQLPKLPDWLPAWGVDGNLRDAWRLYCAPCRKIIAAPVSPSLWWQTDLLSFGNLHQRTSRFSKPYPIMLEREREPWCLWMHMILTNYHQS
ncbi:MAG: DUF3418 domain-containing protein [Akkermansiaceae bacterium]|nr:DUF3418 domain-containing protein [Akkermansiaceae bacterium]